MSFVAAAVVSGAVFAGYASKRAADKASDATSAASANAADATVQATQMQINEIARQFDYQTAILEPFVQNQQAANQAYGAALGLDPNAPQTGPYRDPNIDYTRLGAASGADSELGQNLRQTRLAGETPEQDLAIRRAAETRLGNYITGDESQRRASSARLGRSITGGEAGGRARSVLASNLITGDESQQRAGAERLSNLITGDESSGRANDVRLAAPGGYENDPRFNFARSTEVVGPNFETSPGYEFMVEQAGREVDRKNSAGGNYGGRALLEAQRRAEGLAAGEYYNYVGARQAELGRQDSAIAAYQGREATDVARGDIGLESDIARRVALGAGDVSRGDVAVESDTARRLATGQADISRGDVALESDLARRLGVAEVDLARGDRAVETDTARRLSVASNDISRGDQALESYYGRAAGDATRMDQATVRNQELQARDIQHADQAYYNYLASLGAGAGLNVGAPQAVSASSAAGANTANAYGQQGTNLASIYQQQGVNEANIAIGGAQGVNNAVQGGISNYLLYQGLQNPAPQPTL